jgi:dihydrofolate reductase
MFFFEGPNRDITWHSIDKDFKDYGNEQLGEVSAILFGRVTYELMASFWPAELAQQDGHDE